MYINKQPNLGGLKDMSACSIRFFSFFIFLFFSFSIFHLYSREFLYPIAAIEHSDGGSMVYVMHQKSSTQTELLLWNPATKQTFRGLSGSFCLAGFALLPQQDGFSFIDGGRIRIKFFEKRAPCAIDLYEPLSNITLVHWINSDSMYLSAKKDGCYGIFQVSAQGEVATILTDTQNDYLYPCKVNDQLFYCQRSRGRHTYKIMSIPYPDIETKNHCFNDTCDLEERMKILIFGELVNSSSSKIELPVSTLICDTRQIPVIFLHMISIYEGFYLEHQQTKEEQEKIIRFYYHRIHQEETIWRDDILFSFSLPWYLIDVQGAENLYESILPLRPRHIGNSIYFSDSCGDEHMINLKCYNILTQEVSIQAKAGQEEQFFSPVVVGQKLCFGGLISDDATALCRLLREKKGKVAIDLPVVPL